MPLPVSTSSKNIQELEMLVRALREDENFAASRTPCSGLQCSLMFFTHFKTFLKSGFEGPTVLVDSCRKMWLLNVIDMSIIQFIKCDSHQGPTSLAAFALCLLPIGILVEEAWPLVGANGLGCGRGPEKLRWRASVEITTGSTGDSCDCPGRR